MKFIRKAGLFLAASLIALSLTIVYANGTAKALVTFPDIQNHWAKAYIEDLADQQIVTGNNQGNFVPDGLITRGQFASMIVEAMNITANGTVQFVDVEPTRPDFAAIGKAVGAGIVSGYPDSLFRPDQRITRQEIAVMIDKALQQANKTISVPNPAQTLAQFTDHSTIAAWAESSVAAMAYSGILFGRHADLFAPLSIATRAEAAVFVYNILRYMGQQPRSGGPTPSGSYSFIVIPDTQALAAGKKQALNTMAQWIENNATALNLKMVMHVGDIVNDGAFDVSQFAFAREAFSSLIHSEIPIIFAAGNHDYNNNVQMNRRAAVYNHYFGLANFANQPWFGDTFEPGQIENNYLLLNFDGLKYLILTLEYGPRNEVLAWANEVLDKYTDYDVIVNTHSYMYIDGTRVGGDDAHSPKNTAFYSGTIDANDGEEMWTKLIKLHANMVAVFNGHHIETAENPYHVSYRTDYGDSGNRVLQSFQNYQGANSYFRIVTVNVSADTIRMQMFDPITEAYLTSPGFDVAIPMSPSDPNGEVVFPNS